MSPRITSISFSVSHVAVRSGWRFHRDHEFLPSSLASLGPLILTRFSRHWITRLHCREPRSLNFANHSPIVAPKRQTMKSLLTKRPLLFVTLSRKRWTNAKKRSRAFNLRPQFTALLILARIEKTGPQDESSVESGGRKRIERKMLLRRTRFWTRESKPTGSNG